MDINACLLFQDENKSLKVFHAYFRWRKESSSKSKEKSYLFSCVLFVYLII